MSDGPDLFWEVHSGLWREGPGDDGCTRRALHRLGDLPPHPRILDVGCGPGAQTLVLAQETGGTVIALDNHAPFLEVLARRAQDAGVGDAIQTVEGSMFSLDFPPIRGFEDALRACLPLLRPGGALAATECTWLVADPPEEARRFWDEAYPAMQAVDANLDTVRGCGYTLVGHFVLPASAWEAYHGPMERRISELEARYSKDREALDFLAGERAEIDFYTRLGHSFGYVFYLMRRPEQAAPPAGNCRPPGGRWHRRT